MTITYSKPIAGGRIAYADGAQLAMVYPDNAPITNYRIIPVRAGGVIFATGYAAAVDALRRLAEGREM